MKAAEQVEREDQGLASLLRRKAAPDLRKPRMLTLVRLWGYRSDLWQPRGTSRREAREREKQRKARMNSPSDPQPV